MTRLYLPLSRRTFVRLSAYGGAAMAFGAGAGCSTSGAAPEQVENLIIGSGFGGSITAYRLAQAGHSSVLLERGRRWTIPRPGADVFSNMGLGEADHRCAWLATQQPLPGIPARQFTRYTGVLEKIIGDGIDIVCAAAVGGGSIVYSGMMVQPPQDLFDQVFGSTGVTWAEMDAMYYPRVRSMMGTPTPLPDDIFNHPRWIATHAYLAQADRAGYATGGTGRRKSDRLYCAFDWNGARMERDGMIPEQLMRGSYIFGLNSDAKGTLDKYYLGMAERSGHTEVRELHWAQRIIQRSDGWLVEVDAIDTTGRVMGTRQQILARRLFVCAGTANTTGLLLRAKAEHTIDGLPDALGEGFGNNGQHIMARKSVGVNTLNAQAGPACAMIFDYDAKIGMENGPAPLPYTTDQQILISTGQGIPDRMGTLSWDATMGKVVPHWMASNDQTARDAATAILNALNRANAGTIATNELGLDNKPITFHPLGGCVMGQATDRFGRVMGQRRLYVIDGSLIPGSTPCSNPFWTVSANAERCIENIVANDFT